MNNESGNGTPWFVSECTLRLDGEWRRVCLFLLYLLAFSAGLLENLLVLWVNWRRRRTAAGVLFCVLNVSLSDLMVSGVLPFFMLEVTVERVWLWGRFLCKLSSLLYGLNFYSSSFFLAAATLERYLALSSRPALFRGRRRWALCAAVWLFSLFLALLENVHVDLLEWDEPGCFMLPEGDYVEWFVSVALLCLLFQFLGPASVIVACNVLMARAVRKAPPPPPSEGGDGRRRRRVWVLHVYSLIFLACWLPYHLVMTLMIVSDLAPHAFSCNVVEFVYFSFSIVQSLSLFHCVANPILYSFLSDSFRDDLLDTLLRRLPAPRGRADPRKPSNGSTAQSDVGS
ncbi:G-protein coupled receptor 182 [Stigmatopora nigra]